MFSLDVPSDIEEQVDVGILGGGPAGMTAAVYAARKKLSVGIITKDIGGQVSWTLGIENYMGYQYVTGKELAAKFEEQVRQFPVPILIDEVSGIEGTNDEFKILTRGGREIGARTVIIATGKRPRQLNVPGEERLVGRGVSYCATCDGAFFSDVDVAVCGGGNSAIQAALEMSKIASRVYLVSRSPWRADAIISEKAEKILSIEKKIGFDVLEILGDKTVSGLRISNKSTGEQEILPVKGVFVEIGLVPNTGFLEGFVKLNEHGEVIVDCDCRTSVPGVFAAGDVTQVHEKQIVVAAGEGAKAALSAHEYLLKR